MKLMLAIVIAVLIAWACPAVPTWEQGFVGGNCWETDSKVLSICEIPTPPVIPDCMTCIAPSAGLVRPAYAVCPDGWTPVYANARAMCAHDLREVEWR